MNKPLAFLEDAIAEGRSAWEWYADRSAKAGQRFQDALDKAWNEILEDPRRWPT